MTVTAVLELNPNATGDRSGRWPGGAISAGRSAQQGARRARTTLKGRSAENRGERTDLRAIGA